MADWRELFKNKKRTEGAEFSTIELLASVPLFEDFSKRELAAVERILHLREYQQDELIFRQGDRGMGMYIVLKGKVAVLSEPDNHELSELSDGDFFGEVALLDESYRSATVKSKTDSKVFGFFQPDLYELIERDTRLGLKIVMRVARHACLRLRQSNDRVIALTAQIDALKNSQLTEMS